MPADRAGTRTSRKGHYSCEFCRARKLRCDRKSPCANCASRGKHCCYGVDVVPEQSLPLTPVTDSPQPSIPHDSAYRSLLLEVQSLKRLAKNLEERVSQQATLGNIAISKESSTNGSASSQPDDACRIQRQVGNEVAYLEQVVIGQHSYERSFIENVIFKIESIRNIPEAPTYETQFNQPTRCIRLPRYEEARSLMDTYVSNVGYIAHITHHPSLPDVIDDVYQQVAGREPKNPGCFILLLATLANATYSWDYRGNEDDVFPSATAAYSQVNIWVKAAQDVLNASQHTPPYSLEGVQGTIMLSFAVANMEGFSPRYRSLMSTALWMGRELGLHRWDEPGKVHTENTIRVEVGRRVWWYLSSTDWLLASRYTAPTEGIYQVHPKHMMVKKPRNIDDSDLFNHGDSFEKPLAQPTEMSYFLQRVRLAEISRNLVDRTALKQSHKLNHTDLVATDVELDTFLNEMPPFFNLENCPPTSGCGNMSSFVVQTYMLNCHVHMQRCKLHIPYLKTDLSNPLYEYSRKKCLTAARHIVQNELRLEKSQHPFLNTRLRFSAILHGVFMASIVLLMDACVNQRPLSLKFRDGEASEALRILGRARKESLAASTLLDSLMQVLRSHKLEAHGKISLGKEQESRIDGSGTLFSSNTVQSLSPDSHSAACSEQTKAMHHHTPSDSISTFDQTNAIDMLENVTDAENEATYFNELAQSLEGLPDAEKIQWDDLLATLSSSCF